MLPIIKDTLRAATMRKPSSQQKSTLDKQAEQRKKILERMKNMQDQNVIFKVTIPSSQENPLAWSCISRDMCMAFASSQSKDSAQTKHLALLQKSRAKPVS